MTTLRALALATILVAAGATNLVFWYAFVWLGIVNGMMQTQAQANAVMGWAR